MSHASYTIHYEEHGIVIEGGVPFSDLETLVNLGKEHGYDILDAKLSGAIKGATMVITNREHSAAWRKELGLDG